MQEEAPETLAARWNRRLRVPGAIPRDTTADEKAPHSSTAMKPWPSVCRMPVRRQRGLRDPARFGLFGRVHNLT
jgi:hypothetical protein